jgi:pilus assembly protein CpaF
MVDARLADGSRLNAVLPPVAIGSPLISLRRPPVRHLGIEELVDDGSVDGSMAAFLHAAVIGRCNLIISGGAASGKTTLLAALCDLVPEQQRLVVLEDVAEIATRHPHAVRQETRPGGCDGGRRVTLGDLVRNSLRMRPDRLVVGEVRGDEVADMLAAMNTGQDGSMTTVHANNPVDALARLETLLAIAWRGEAVATMKTWISRAIDLVVHCERGADGRRWISEIAAVDPDARGELTGVAVHRLRAPVPVGVANASACGEVPRRCLERMARHGILFPPRLFSPNEAA